MRDGWKGSMAILRRSAYCTAVYRHPEDEYTMKILHVAQMIKGGPASYLQEVLPFQVKRYGGNNVVVLVSEEEKKYLSGINTLCIIGFRSGGRGVVGLSRFAKAIYDTILTQKPDIVHLHSSFAGAIGRIVGALPSNAKPKIVYCAHGWSFNMKVSKSKRLAYQYLERLFELKSDAIVCISQFEYQEAVKRGFSPDRLHLVPNGVHDIEIDEIEQQVLSGETLNLLYVGRQDRQKGFDVLAEAMRNLQSLPIALHVLGEAVVSRNRPVVRLPNIRYHGWKSREEVRSFMAGADALVMPSRWEGFGLAAVEAMRQQLPVCASAVDALPELVVEGVSGYLFPPDNSPALARLLAGLDRPKLRALGGSARQWFLDNYTSDRMNNGLAQVYDRVMAIRK